MKPIALDTCAAIAFLRREPGGDRVAGWLHEAARGDRRLLLHRLCLGEVYYLTAGAKGKDVADAQLAKLRRLPWDSSGPLGFELLRLAGRLKVDHGVPYVDAVAGAWALLNDAALATTDRKAFAAAARGDALEVIFLR